MYAPSLKLTFSHLKKTGWLEYRNTSFLLVPGPRSGAKMLVSSTMQRANNFPESFFPNQQHFLLILGIWICIQSVPMGMSGPGPKLLIRWEPLPTAANFFPVVPLPVFEKDPLIQLLHLHSVYSWTFQFGCLTWFRFRDFQCQSTIPYGSNWRTLEGAAVEYFMLDILQTCLASDYDSWACTLYITLPETNSSHLKMTPGKGESYWKPPFLGAMLVLGRVYSIWHSQEQCSTTTCAILGPRAVDRDSQNCPITVITHNIHNVTGPMVVPSLTKLTMS